MHIVTVSLASTKRAAKVALSGGAILRRDNFVVGVTTAATLWFLTVMGLCFGGGQVALGVVGAALALLILTGLKLIEKRMKQDHRASFW